MLLHDAQTSGGLLLAAPPVAAPALLADLTGRGLTAAVIGEVVPGPPGRITVRAEEATPVTPGDLRALVRGERVALRLVAARGRGRVHPADQGQRRPAPSVDDAARHAGGIRRVHGPLPEPVVNIGLVVCDRADGAIVGGININNIVLRPLPERLPSATGRSRRRPAAATCPRRSSWSSATPSARWACTGWRPTSSRATTPRSGWWSATASATRATRPTTCSSTRPGAGTSAGPSPARWSSR